MLKIGEDVHPQATGQIGTVFGYSNEMMHGMYLTTLKVRMKKHKGTRRCSKFGEDIYSTWVSEDMG